MLRFIIEKELREIIGSTKFAVSFGVCSLLIPPRVLCRGNGTSDKLLPGLRLPRRRISNRWKG